MSRPDPSQIVRRAAAAFNAGHADEARALCEDGLRRWPDDPALNHLLAAVHLSGGGIAAARRCIEASLLVAPQHPPARLLAARIAQAASEFDAALTHLDHPALVTSGPERLLERARLLSRMPRRDDARAAWQAVLGVQPQNREAMARLGRLAWEDGDPTTATALLERAVAGDCPASTWFDLGLARLDLQDHGGAATAFRRALDEKPEDAEAAVNLGGALQETGDIDGAMAAFGIAYRLRPSTFGTIAMALTSAPHGRIWLAQAALRRSLGG